jgi:hypothetical protein
MTRDDIIRMARECQMPHFYQTGEIANLERLTRFAALVAAAEREACAKVAETIQEFGLNVATAIRARGQG